MQIDKNKFERVLAVSSLYATRRSKLIVATFVLITIFLSVGVLFKIWPIVIISIKPELITINKEIEIKVDLDASSNLAATMTIPGRIKVLGEDDNTLMTQGYLIRTIQSTSIVFSKKDLNLIISKSLEKIISPEAVILPSSIIIDEGNWTISKSGRIFHGLININAKYYIKPFLANWSKEIVGVDKYKAVDILSQKNGVSFVKIEVYPIFLAKISNKIPKSINNIRFILDTD